MGMNTTTTIHPVMAWMKRQSSAPTGHAPSASGNAQKANALAWVKFVMAIILIVKRLSHTAKYWIFPTRIRICAGTGIARKGTGNVQMIRRVLRRYEFVMEKSLDPGVAMMEVMNLTVMNGSVIHSGHVRLLMGHGDSCGFIFFH